MTEQEIREMLEQTEIQKLLEEGITRETRPDGRYDETGQEIISEVVENTPYTRDKPFYAPIQAVAGDGINYSADALNLLSSPISKGLKASGVPMFTGEGFLGDLIYGGSGKALNQMAYGHQADKQDMTDLGLLGVAPLIGGAKAAASAVPKLQEMYRFMRPSDNIPIDDMNDLAKDRAKFLEGDMIATYKNRPDTMGGRKIDTDIVREQFPEYNNSDTLINQLLGTTGSRYRSPDIHEGASDLSKVMYKDLLDAPLPKGASDKVTFTAGSAGAGKGRVMSLLSKKDAPDANSKAFYDTNLSSFDSAKKKIDMAIKSGTGKTPVDIFYVYRPLGDAFKGTIKRTGNQAEKFGSGRVVTVDAMTETALGSLDTIRKLEKAYENNPLVNIKIVDNTTEVPKIITTKQLPQVKTKAEAEKELFKILREERAKPDTKITDEVYSRIMRGRKDPIAEQEAFENSGEILGDVIYGY